MLTVIESCKEFDGRGNKLWVCRCDCGKIIKRTTNRLNICKKNKVNTDCGCGLGRMHYKQDLAGQRFGMLTAIRKTNPKHYSKHRYIAWTCKCDCGNTCDITRGGLISGLTKSCGCLRAKSTGDRVRYKDREYAMFKQLYMKLCIRHKKYSSEEIISFNEFEKMSNSECYYCGLLNSNKLTDRIINSEYVLHYNGIDRIDSSKGYTKDNVVPCCKYCNIAKNDTPQKDFLNHIKRIYEHKFNKGEQDAA